jgi:hypothetical protein
MKHLIPLTAFLTSFGTASSNVPDTIQYVIFQTTQPREQFIPNWMPFANGFLRTGLQNIILSESNTSYKFISRNLWTKTAFERTLGTNRLGNGGGNGIRAIQAGAYRTERISGLAEVQNTNKIMAFFNSKNPAQLKKTLLEISTKQRIILLEPANNSAIYDLVLEIYNPSAGLLEQIEALKPSHIAVYKEVLALP